MTIIESGAMAHTTQDVVIDGRRYVKGQQLIIEDYISAEEADDGVPFYWGSANGGMNNIWIRADSVELAKSADDMRKRTIPTVEAILDAISSEVMFRAEGFYTDETCKESPSTLSVYGETDDGLNFGFTLSLTGLQQVDP